MMKTLSDFVVRVADLAEAEGRLLRHHSVRTATTIGLALAAAGLLLAGILSLLAALFVGLRERLGPAPAWAIVGVSAIGLAFVLLWIVGRRTDAPAASRLPPTPSPLDPPGRTGP